MINGIIIYNTTVVVVAVLAAATVVVVVVWGRGVGAARSRCRNGDDFNKKAE